MASLACFAAPFAILLQWPFLLLCLLLLLLLWRGATVNSSLFDLRIRHTEGQADGQFHRDFLGTKASLWAGLCLLERRRTTTVVFGRTATFLMHTVAAMFPTSPRLATAILFLKSTFAFLCHILSLWLGLLLPLLKQLFQLLDIDLKLAHLETLLDIKRNLGLQVVTDLALELLLLLSNVGLAELHFQLLTFQVDL